MRGSMTAIPGCLVLTAVTWVACSNSGQVAGSSASAGAGGDSSVAHDGSPESSLPDISSADATTEPDWAPIEAAWVDVPGWESEQEARFALPLPYRAVAASARQMLQDYRQLYLDGDPAKDFVQDPPTKDCATQEPLTVWSKIYGWHMIGPLAETLYYGAHVFEGDPVDPTLASDCRTAVIDIGDHVIDHANATEFGGAMYQDPFDGTTKSFLGWNNFRGRWDAWGNGTCPPQGSASSWASAWALNTLALAHRISGEERFRRAFHRGISYYHQEKTGNDWFKAGYAQYAEILTKLDANPPYILAPLYTVGGNRFANPNLDPFPWSLHYHYKGVEDPVRNTLNTNATMAQALLNAGLGDGTLELPVAIPAGGFSSLDYQGVAWRVMYSIYANLANGNITYVDLDDVGYSAANLDLFEAHLIAAALHLTKASGLLDNAYFGKTALETANRIHTDTFRWPSEGDAKHPLSDDQIMAEQLYRAVCAVRTLPAKLTSKGMAFSIQIDPMQKCKDYLGAVPEAKRYYLWNLYSALYQPEI